MAYSYNEVGAISPGQNISVPFKFLDREHVSVLVDGVVTDKYTWLNNGMVQATTGFPIGTVTRIERNTPVALLKAVLEGTAVFDFEGVNNNFSLLLFILQEYSDKENVRNDQIAFLFDAIEGQLSGLAEAVQTAESAATMANTSKNAAADSASIASAAASSTAGSVQQAAASAETAVSASGVSVTSKEQAEELLAQATGLVLAAASGFTGFDPNTGYDFGSIATQTTYFNRDWGSI